MNPELILRLVSLPVLASWLAMALAPRARITRAFIHSDVVPLVIGVVYLALMAPLLPGVMGQFDTFAHISAAFTNPTLVLAGWIHYLAFDLIIGRVILGDAQRRGIHHLLVVPCLFLTFMFGPVGYLTYAIVRAVSGRLAGAVAPLPALAK